MAAASEGFATTITPGAPGIRSEARKETLRIVEYSHFPRVAQQPQQRVCFTRDLSQSGLCLGVDECEPVGSLLRLCVRNVDGRREAASVGRVAWTSAERDGRYWLGVELLARALTRQAVVCSQPTAKGGFDFNRFHA